ncbi:unnamed protein product, partial [Ectocarpus sp. 12 AP-2014]
PAASPPADSTASGFDALAAGSPSCLGVRSTSATAAATAAAAAAAAGAFVPCSTDSGAASDIATSVDEAPAPPSSTLGDFDGAPGATTSVISTSSAPHRWTRPPLAPTEPPPPARRQRLASLSLRRPPSPASCLSLYPRESRRLPPPQSALLLPPLQAQQRRPRLLLPTQASHHLLGKFPACRSPPRRHHQSPALLRWKRRCFRSCRQWLPLPPPP